MAKSTCDITNQNSNTSHVPIYRLRQESAANRTTNSNTSHVPIYLHLVPPFTTRILFKYISCSYLSHRLTSMCTATADSNTSHVPIYQHFDEHNLSCSYIQIHLMFLFIMDGQISIFDYMGFKYISCSYLSSPFVSGHSLLTIQIHLMFLFIQFRKDFVNLRGHSNTSHVPIYQQRE